MPKRFRVNITQWTLNWKRNPRSLFKYCKDQIHFWTELSRKKEGEIKINKSSLFTFQDGWSRSVTVTVSIISCNLPAFFHPLTQSRCQCVSKRCRSEEHSSHESPHLPGAAVGGHCPGLNYHSAGPQIGGHPQNNRYGSEGDSCLWLKSLLRGGRKAHHRGHASHFHYSFWLRGLPG